MQPTQFDVLCLGNAIVDVICRVDDDLLVQEGIVKGSMTLIDGGRADHLYGAMGDVSVVSGGSAANTAVGLASLGARAAFIGKVRDDDVGAHFTRDLRAAGVHYATAPAAGGPATARSYIMVTPDGQRSMNTYLGACQNLTSQDVDPDLVRTSAITYLEGYLWDPPEAKLAFTRAAEISHAAGQRVAITLSDSFCVDRYRAEFLDLIRRKTVDIVFANASELHALYQTADLETALAELRRDCSLASVTMGAEGALVVSAGGIERVAAEPIEALIDTTGAGDLFASGFLAGLVRGMSQADCARLGGLAAAEIIQHIGAHPKERLSDLAAKRGLSPNSQFGGLSPAGTAA